MAGQTQMIIITSNEDIIRQFALNKITNTHIIDLDNGKQVTSITNNNNSITDLAFFAGLSEQNSSSDQIYKRALDSSDQNLSKPVKASKKSIDLICTICGDHAIGYNYDVLSCAACKAFFRRNAAHQYSEKIRCITGRGQCSVAHEIHRKCARCRLDRCFAMGMRKDFIISEEEKGRKRKCLEENRNMTAQRLSSTSESTNTTSSSSPNSLPNFEFLSPVLDDIDHLLMDMNENNEPHESSDSDQMEEILFDTLSVEHWIQTENVRSLFLSMCHSDNMQCPFKDVQDRVSGLIAWSKMANQMALCFINFFRQIDEFQGLHVDDRFILIKYNLLPLFPIMKCYHYKLIGDCCSMEDNEEVKRDDQFFILCDNSLGIRETFISKVISLVQVTEQDPTMLSLLLIILLFSQGLSMSEDEPPLKDSLAVNRAQFHYTELLWQYLVNKWDVIEASRRFTQLFYVIIRIQSAAKRFREFFRVQLIKTDTVDKIAPLMQSVLHIS